MDWDKVRIFHAAAQAGSFTRAGEALKMSQSAVSRQVSGLEADLNVPLFHRHARGLVLTEQGELLFQTAHDVFTRLESAQIQLTDSKTKPFGPLRVTTTVGLGSSWLTPRLPEFIELYPDINLELMLYDGELDLAMRKADVAIWFREPTQNDLIRRRLFTVHFHIYASPAYLNQYGSPETIDDLDNHQILTFGGDVPKHIRQINWLQSAGLTDAKMRRSALTVNNIYALKRAAQSGVGLAVLPDYMLGTDVSLVQVMRDAAVPEFRTWFVYAEELRNSKRVTVFRDFLLSKSREWSF